MPLTLAQKTMIAAAVSLGPDDVFEHVGPGLLISIDEPDELPNFWHTIIALDRQKGEPLIKGRLAEANAPKPGTSGYAFAAANFDSAGRPLPAPDDAEVRAKATAEWEALRARAFAKLVEYAK